MRLWWNVLEDTEAIEAGLDGHIPYADVGMIVNFHHRQQGIRVFILAQLKDYCYSHYVKPICSCAFDNIASRKTIEKAGFITQHCILDIQLQ